MKSLLLKERFYRASVQRLKTETRRLHKLDIINDHPERYRPMTVDEKHYFLENSKSKKVHNLLKCNPSSYFLYYRLHRKKGRSRGPYTEFNPFDDAIIIKPKYMVGEVVFIAEPIWISDTVIVSAPDTFTDIDGTYILYDYDPVPDWINGNIKDNGLKYLSKLFCSAKYARHFAVINSVRIERLQDLTVAGALREGITGRKPVEQFRAAWNDINRPNSWSKNPWVFVYSYNLTNSDIRNEQTRPTKQLQSQI